MSKTPKTVELNDWQHYFAMEYNNRAWDLSVQPTRTAEEDHELLNVAHASAMHWHIVGTELNHMRATMLLAEVHALLGFGASALAYAEEMRAFFLERESPDWEIAFVHTIHAHAAHVAGKQDLYTESYAKAVQAIDAIAEEKERKIVLDTFTLVPPPESLSR